MVMQFNIGQKKMQRRFVWKYRFFLGQKALTKEGQRVRLFGFEKTRWSFRSNGWVTFKREAA